MKKNLLGILGTLIFITLFAYFARPLFTPQIESNMETEPFWVIEADQDRLSVFNLTLEESTLEELLFMLGNRLSLSIFEEEGEYQLEGYIRETLVGGLSARIPFTLEAEQSLLESISAELKPHKRSTSKRTIYEVPQDQHFHFMQNIVQSLAFIPMAVTLDESIVFHHFGTPSMKIEEAENSVIHYLYPEKGVDIALDPTKKRRSVVQYIVPKYFDQYVVQPLLDNGGTLL